jgi:hypothetical protein
LNRKGTAPRNSCSIRESEKAPSTAVWKARSRTTSRQDFIIQHTHCTQDFIIQLTRLSLLLLLHAFLERRATPRLGGARVICLSSGVVPTRPASRRKYRASLNPITRFRIARPRAQWTCGRWGGNLICNEILLPGAPRTRRHMSTSRASICFCKNVGR